jgi:hypothetical protein
MAESQEITLNPPVDDDEARGLRALRLVAVPPPGPEPGEGGPDPVVEMLAGLDAWLSGSGMLVLVPGSGLIAVDPQTGRAVWWLGAAGGDPDG